MAKTRTLSMIKPDAMEKNKSGAILARFQEEGFTVKAMKRVKANFKYTNFEFSAPKAR